jgi:hypothetical protein
MTQSPRSTVEFTADGLTITALTTDAAECARWARQEGHC